MSIPDVTYVWPIRAGSFLAGRVAPSQGETATAGADPTPDAARFIGLLNDYRTSRGRPALATDPTLVLAAQTKAAAILETGIFDHTINGVTAPENAYRSGYPREGRIGENILWGQPDAGTALRVWQSSGPHDANLLGDEPTSAAEAAIADYGYKAVGVAGPVGTAKTGIRQVWVAVFGTVAPVAPPEPPQPTPEPAPVPEGPIAPNSPWRALKSLDSSIYRKVLNEAGSPLLAAVDGFFALPGFAQWSALLLMHAYLESSLGKAANARQTNNFLGLMDDSGSTLVRFANPVDCAAEFVRRKNDPNWRNGAYKNANTMAEYIRTYVAGPGPGYANGETPQSVAAYLAHGLDLLNGWFALGPPTPPPNPPPDVETITFGKVPVPSNFTKRIITNSSAWDNLGVRFPAVGVCLHRMYNPPGKQGLDGTDGYFRGQAAGTALTDYGVGGGFIYQWNEWATTVGNQWRSPWANGPASDVEGPGNAFMSRYGVNGVNRLLVSIEIAGYYTSPFDLPDISQIHPSQILPCGCPTFLADDFGDAKLADDDFERVVEVVAYVIDRSSIAWNVWPLNNAGISAIYGHGDFGPKECPGSAVRSRWANVIDAVRDRLYRYQTGKDQPPPGPPPIPVYPDTQPIPVAWTGDDYTAPGGAIFRALKRNYAAKADGAKVYLYADAKSAEVRSPLRKGEKFAGEWEVESNGEVWIVTSTGARIRSVDAAPEVKIA